MIRSGTTLLLLAFAVAGCSTERHSFDLALDGTGIGLGNSRALNGLRLNLRDDQVAEVNGVNVTLWPPGENPEFAQRGLALALFRTDSREMIGVSLAPVVGGVDLYGVNAGLLATSGSGIVRGLNLGMFHTWGGEELSGINAGLVVSGGHLIRGLTVGALYISPQPTTDLLEPHWGWLEGCSASGLVIDYPGAHGLTLAGLIRVRQLRGLALGWFLTDVREDARGLCVAPFNFAKRLTGVQIGLLNHVDSNPHPFKWLPGLNIGFGAADGEGEGVGP